LRSDSKCDNLFVLRIVVCFFCVSVKSYHCYGIASAEPRKCLDGMFSIAYSITVVIDSKYVEVAIVMTNSKDHYPVYYVQIN